MTGRQTALTITLLGGALAIAFEAYGVLTAMPAAAEALGRLDLYAWAFTAFVIAQVLAIVIAGRLVDRIGPVVPLATGLGVFALGLLGAGFASSMEWLLVTRFVQGLGAGATNLSFMVLVAQAFGKAERAWLMSALSFCWVLPSFIGPPIAAWITTRFGWHWVFLGVVPFLVLVALPGIAPMTALQRNRVPAGPPGKQVPIWAAFAVAIGAAALQLAGQRLDLPGAGAAVAGLAVLAIGLPALMPKGFLRMGKGLPAVMTTRGLASGALFAAESFLPLLLIRAHGFTLGQAGLFLALGASGWAIGSTVQALRSLRIRRDQIIQLGAGLMVLGLAPMPLVAWLHLHWMVLAVGFITCGTGMGMLVSSTSLANMQISEPELLGRNTASLQVSEGLGNSIVTGLAGSLFAALHLASDPAITFTPIYLLCLAVAVATALVSLRVGPVRNESSGVG